MIPVSLTIQGLYSYREKQTIDFETLTSGQLFGIFGGVGSGKSSILEAIMFVLYDRSPRLSKSGDNRYYNMLNLQSDSMLVDFTFRAGEQNEGLYRFVFSAKRKKKDFEKVEVKERNYYQWKGDDWVPLPDKTDTAQVVGMSYEHFMQTIIIPQGKFREFIDQKPADRTRMLQELFHLHKFDLAQPAGKLLKDTEFKLQNLEGRLESLGEISEEQLKEQEGAITELRTEVQESRKKLAGLRDKQKECRRLEELVRALKEYTDTLTGLKEEEETYQTRRKNLEHYETAYSQFKERLNYFESLSNDRQAKETKIGSLEAEEQRLLKASEQAQEDYQKAETAYNQREELRQKLEDLQLIIALKADAEKEDALKQRVEKEEGRCQELKQQQLYTSNLLDDIRQRISEAEQEHTGEGQIHTAIAAVKAREDHKARNKEIRESLEKTLNGIKTLERRYREKAEAAGVPADGTPQEVNELVTTKREDEESSLQTLQTEKHRLQVKDRLANLAGELSEGEPCPLCGATHHPDVATFDSLHGELALISEKEESHKKKLIELNTLRDELTVLAARIEAGHQTLTQQQEELRRHEAKTLQDIPEEYTGQSLQELETSLQKIEAGKTTLAKLKNDLRDKERSLEKTRNELEQETRQCHQSQADLKVVTAGITDKKGRIKVLSLQDMFSHSIEQLKNNAEKGQAKIGQIEERYRRAREEADLSRQKYSQIRGSLTAEKEALQTLVERQTKEEASLNELAREKEYGTLQTVKELLARPLNVSVEKEQLQAYDRQVHSLTQQLEKCKHDIGDATYREEEHRETDRLVEEEEATLTGMEKELAVLEREKEDNLKRLEKVRHLLQEQEELHIRRDNLKDMASLFRGSGFVNYVSTIRLNDLCRAANERFFKLTRSNLSLELNENNEFVVRDYLNNGRTRLLKTLSGGQTFQAALCLALALAENIRSLNQADQSFFFLDEGFGSLDKESLRIVFETLKSLRKENRIVGIISHVEELQQEIDLYLKVENDKEKGSVISYSWK